MKRFFFNLTLFVILVFSAMAALKGTTAAQEVVAAVPATKDAAVIRNEAFQLVWQTIKDKHFDPTFGGVDWDKVRERYAPRAEAAPGPWSSCSRAFEW